MSEAAALNLMMGVGGVRRGVRGAAGYRRLPGVRLLRERSAVRNVCLKNKPAHHREQTKKAPPPPG